MTITYASKDDRTRLAKLIKDLHADGWVRSAIVEATRELDPAAILVPAAQWRISHKGRAHAHEVKIVDALVEAIKAGKIKKPEVVRGSGKPGRVSQLEAQVAELQALVASLVPAEAKA